MRTIVVDASVAIKWFVPEIHSEHALILHDPEFRLHAPDLLLPELANILWKKVQRGEVTSDMARGILLAMRQAPVEFHGSAALIESALEIALGTVRTAYDSLYIALAVSLGASMLTADLKLCRALQSTPLAQHCKWIEDIST